VINEIIYQIKKNSLFTAHHLSLIDEKQTNKLNFLQRKRENDHFKLRTNKDFVFQKGINFTISNSNKNIGNINQNNESENVNNDFLRYLINFGENSCKKLFGESLDNSNPKENNQINYIISNDKKTNLINMSFINKNSMDIDRIKNFSAINNNYEKISSDETNIKNGIKVLKNKKAVYINNRYLLNSYSDLKALKKVKIFKFEIRKKTSSKYRGVSKNGNKWQVLIMINKKICYIGSYISEEKAARIYDILAIKNFGIKAKTNFIYNHFQIKKINESQINIKSDKISDIIEHLIK
jgi:hypothetical protein